jgi:dihydroorotate dehydrogenase
MVYDLVIKPLLFALDPEQAHEVMRAASRSANLPTVSRVLGRFYRHTDPRLETSVAGISFRNPLGLAAGFDKNADLVGICTALGFGHLELGTVTGRAQPGNPRPRIFRLPADQALINRMGFPSHGADALGERLALLRKRFSSLPPLGINIGKSKEVALESAVEDYLYSFTRLAPFADYIAVNVSSPNTQDLRQLQDRDRLSQILTRIQQANTAAVPVFVKVAPDLGWAALEDAIACCLECGVAGIIATNTTLGRSGISTVIDQVGGLSGAPLRERALEVVRFLGERINGRLALIGVGGVATAEDLLAMLAAGASLVQIYTGLIYGGPGLIKRILTDLSLFMDRTHCSSLSDAAQAWREIRCSAA